MYLMFVATGADKIGLDNKIHLVEWEAEGHTVTDIEEEFQLALDHYSATRPYMGDWSMILALTIVNGRKIVPVDQPVETPPNSDRMQRIFNAVKSRGEG